MVDLPTVFMDRDGVINVQIEDYLTKWKQFKFLPNVLEVLKVFNENNFRVIVVTNQSMISKGLTTKMNLESIHSKMQLKVKEYGGCIDYVYYCPHDFTDKYECRKPKSGMFLKAKKEFGISFNKSIMIGNSWKDMDAASAVGCSTCLLIDSLKDLNKCNNDPDFCISDIYQAKNLVTNFLKIKSKKWRK